METQTWIVLHAEYHCRRRSLNQFNNHSKHLVFVVIALTKLADKCTLSWLCGLVVLVAANHTSLQTTLTKPAAHSQHVDHEGE